ncbi:MAG TPA: alpha/beta hydrolase [Anaeromyxobacteraceae bacterium]|jgi:pimeloyl-ACP methyl ester carboxylesterase|nr:alpha/beta hydrolase [Anaeromyxobacteraceae bacterium]
MTLAALAALLLAASPAPAPRTVRAADGVPIAYDVRGQGKATVVLVHCWACDRSFWKEQVEPLSRRFRVVTLDLGGHGASGDGRATWTVSGLGGDVQAVVEALKLESVILVGHSLGGPVALDAARRMPGRVRGVVAVDSLHDVEKPMPRETAERLAALYEDDFPGTMAVMVRKMLPAGADPAVLDFVTARATSARPGPMVALLRDTPSLDLAAWMEAAHVPVRAIQSGPPLSPPTRIGVNRRHADYDASFMDGVGHYPMLERPAEFNRRLEAAVSELAAPHPARAAR